MNEYQLAEAVALSQYGVCDNCAGDMRARAVTAFAGYYEVELVCEQCEDKRRVRVRPLDMAAYGQTS